MRFLPLISLFLVLFSCGSAYKNLVKTGGDAGCVERFRPAIQTALYNTYVNVVGNHLSGLLIIKRMPDGSQRLVFSNETGFKFFDFEFSQNKFKVHYIFNKMDKKSVIKTLRKDFQLVLMNNLEGAEAYVLKGDSVYYHTFRGAGKDHYYYITDPGCEKLLWMERGNKRKKVVQAVATDFHEGVPDSIHIRHTGFEFEIGLKRINNYAQ